MVNKRMRTKHIKVGLPYGSFKTVELIGDVHISDKLVPKDVMLVKEFKVNLMFIWKLIEQIGIIVNFTRNGCHL